MGQESITQVGLPTVKDSKNEIPPEIIGYVSVRGKQSVFDAKVPLGCASTVPFQAEESARDAVRKHLETLGFGILAESPLGMSVVGNAEHYEALTGGKVIPREKLAWTARGRHKYVTHLDLVGSDQPVALGVARARAITPNIDGVILEKPRRMHNVQPSPVPPDSPKYHLSLPKDVAKLLGASAAHQKGIRGSNIVVAMPDSGWYRHPYFAANDYRVKQPIALVHGTSADQDPVGHGTGESANLFAVAPDAILQPLRGTTATGKFVAMMAAFLKAKELKPRIITNSWGGDGPYPPAGPPEQSDQAIALEIQHAIESGILVVFAAGNGTFTIEPQVPGVLAAGGVYVAANGQRRASDFASGYASPWYPNVVVPTVCGLVGLQPRAHYLMLPVQPGCESDKSEAAADGDEGDGTTAEDGWSLFSGTSAAAPQVAGAAALILSAKPSCTPAQVIEALTKTAIDVVTGAGYPFRFNEHAKPGFDKATGWGLIDASAAVEYALARF